MSNLYFTAWILSILVYSDRLQLRCSSVLFHPFHASWWLSSCQQWHVGPPFRRAGGTTAAHTAEHLPLQGDLTPQHSLDSSSITQQVIHLPGVPPPPPLQSVPQHNYNHLHHPYSSIPSLIYVNALSLTCNNSTQF